MKKIIVPLVIAVLIVVSVTALTMKFWSRPNLLVGAVDVGTQTLVGSSANYKSLPVAFSEANATTTDAALPDGGSTINQLFNLSGVDKVTLFIGAVGGTATSTLSVKPMFSLDGSTYFYIQGNSTSTDVIGTTTPSLQNLVFSLDPGTASTSKSFTFNTPVAKFMRLIVMGEDVSTDPNDGVQAYIQVGSKQTY